jgi:hypothetical protein
MRSTLSARPSTVTLKHRKQLSFIQQGLLSNLGIICVGRSNLSFLQTLLDWAYPNRLRTIRTYANQTFSGVSVSIHHTALTDRNAHFCAIK